MLIYRKILINFTYNNNNKVSMTIAVDYFLLVGFCFALTSGLFLGLKSIKLI